MRLIFSVPQSKFDLPRYSRPVDRLEELLGSYHREASAETAVPGEYSRLLAEQVKTLLPEVRQLLRLRDVVALLISPWRYKATTRTHVQLYLVDHLRGHSLQSLRLETPRRKRPVLRDLQELLAEMNRTAVKRQLI